jgi:hypothetical protein
MGKVIKERCCSNSECECPTSQDVWVNNNKNGEIVGVLGGGEVKHVCDTCGSKLTIALSTFSIGGKAIAVSAVPPRVRDHFDRTHGETSVYTNPDTGEVFESTVVGAFEPDDKLKPVKSVVTITSVQPPDSKSVMH